MLTPLPIVIQTLSTGAPFTFKNKFGVPFLTARYHDTIKCWVAKWVGFVTPEDIIQSSEIKLELMEVFGVQTILNDNRELEGPWYDANDWIQTVWLPRAIKGGVKRLGQILSTDAFAALSATEMISALSVGQDSMELQVFVSLADGLRWAGADQEIIDQYSTY